jgi:hypothetical protein
MLFLGAETCSAHSTFQYGGITYQTLDFFFSKFMEERIEREIFFSFDYIQIEV